MRAADLGRRVDPWLVGAILLAAGAVITAAALAFESKDILTYADTASHVIIPRRVFDNRDPGLPQLGVHWGPMLQLLQIPLVTVNELYRTGLSGTIVSGAATLVTAFYLYRLVVLVSGERHVGFLGVLILLAAPSFLYVSVIPMVYALTMATATGSVYYLTVWAMTGRTGALLGSALMATAATLTNFDTWVLVPLELMAIALIALTGRLGYRRARASVLLWALAGVYGIVIFLFMNVAIYGDPLAFLKPTEGSASYGFAGGGGRCAGGRTLSDILDAASTYPRAIVVLAGLPLALLATAGLLLYVWRWRRDAARLVPLLLLYPLVFYTGWAIFRGAPIVPGNAPADWINLRYASTLYPALAFFLVIGIRWMPLRVLATAAVLAAALTAVRQDAIPALREAQGQTTNVDALQHTAAKLGDNAAGEAIYIPVAHFMVDRFELFSGLPSAAFIDPNDTKQWPVAARRPDRFDVRWIVWLGDRLPARVRGALARAGDAQLCNYTKPGKIPILIYAVGGGSGRCGSFGAGTRARLNRSPLIPSRRAAQARPPAGSCPSLSGVFPEPAGKVLADGAIPRQARSPGNG
jgi:hypothetical protein